MPSHQCCLDTPGSLTHLPLAKFTSILAADSFKCMFLNENRIPIRVSLKFVPRSPIGNKPALVQVIACRRTGNKPLPELILTQFTYAYIWSTRGRWIKEEQNWFINQIFILYNNNMLSPVCTYVYIVHTVSLLSMSIKFEAFIYLFIFICVSFVCVYHLKFFVFRYTHPLEI